MTEEQAEVDQKASEKLTKLEQQQKEQTFP